MAISPKRLVKCKRYLNLICLLRFYKLLPNDFVADTKIDQDEETEIIIKVQKFARIYPVWEYSLLGNSYLIGQYTRYSFRGPRAMNQNKRNRVFPIEEKLAAVEWNLKLLKTSAEITHTPLRTIKSMFQVSVMVPAQCFVQEIVNYRFARRRAS